MSKKLLRILSLIMTAVLVLGLIAGTLATVASAAVTTHQLATLLTEGKIKALGRTQVNTDGNGITANWSANGFEMNVKANGGDFVVGYKTSLSTCYAAVLVDGKQVLRTALYGTGTIKVPLTAGKHTVSVIREQGHANSTTAYLHFTTVAFDGTIEAAPANKSLYVEVVGDSYACGSGSAAGYEAGVQWGDADHTAQGSFGWYLSKMLGADLSIVARGGIGLFDGTSEQEGTPNTVTMRDIYPYASGHNQEDGLYSFDRKPNLVVIELGANDGINNSDPTKSITNWAAKLREMINLVREKNGANTKILLLSHNSTKYAQMLRIADEDANIWACHFSHHGNGSAALATQTAGHPSADDEYEIAEALYKTIQDNRILGGGKSNPTYTDITYYVSENGDDANDGKTPETAMKTIKAVTAKVQADNGGKTGFPAGTRIVINVTGEVYQSTATHQYMGGGQAFYENGTGVKDHKFIPFLITTYNYSGTPATIVYDNDPTDAASASLRMVNNVYLKDINVKSITNEETGYAVTRLYASNTELTIDNVNFSTDGKVTKGDKKWSIFADHYSTGGFNPTKTEWLPFYGTVTFKNGDYTNLGTVAAVGADSLTNGVTELPDVHCKVVIEDGAKMGTVNVAYGTIAVESATVELNGGTVDRILPTPSGKSEAVRTYNTDIKTVFNGSKVTNARYVGTGNWNVINGNLTNEFKRGQYICTLFAGVGSDTVVNGTVTNTISGGEIRLSPTSDTTGNDGIYLGGYKNVTINGELINNLSGGDLNLVYDANVDCGIYLGLRGGKINGNMTNNISGGNLMTVNRDATAKSSGIYLGMYGGNITGTLTNNISAGTLDGSVNFGDRTVGNAIGKIVNVLGVKDSLQGPRILSDFSMGGGWARLGADKGNRALTADDCSDTVVLDNTIYSGYYGGAVYAGVNGSAYNTTHSYISGSVKTNIYGGYFPGGFYGTSGAAVAGHVTTNIYGGTFTSIYGTRIATVFDGVETNIYAMKEYYAVKADNTYGIWAGGNTGKVSAKTEGRDAVKLTIAPEKNEDVILRTPIYAGFAGSGSATGTTTVTVSGGTYPNGFKVDGKTVGEVLASGYAAYGYQSGAKLSYAASDASISGNVEIRSGAPAAGRTLTYYVRPNGNNSNDGTTFISAKKTIKAAIDQAVADNGGSRVFPNGTKLVVYVDGTVYMSTGQNMGYGYLLTTADGEHMETVLTTYNYNGTKATIVQDHTPTNSGSSSICVYTDITLKDVAVVAKKTSGGFVTQRVFASGCTLTLDNASLKTDCGVNWVVAADYFSLGGVHPLNTPETYGTVVFKNGDYTDLANVSAVYSNSIWRSEADGGSVTSVPGKHCKIVVEDGAKLKNVYNTYGTLTVESATVEIRGGEVTNYYGTSGATESAAKTYSTANLNLIVSGGSVDRVLVVGDAAQKITYDTTDKSKVTGRTARDLTVNSNITTTISGGAVGGFEGSGKGLSGKYTDAEGKEKTVTAYVRINGNVTNTFSGGTVGGKTFFALNDYTILTGNLSNTFSGTNLEINPTSTANGGHGIFMAGRSSVIINGNVTNNISAGSVGVLYKVTDIKSGIYMGLRGGWIYGNLTNNITGGTLYTRAENETIKLSYAGIHTTGFSSASISGTVYNNIIGGTFDAGGTIYLGQQGVSGSVNRVVNVIGDKATGTGPEIKNGKTLLMAGGWGRIGVTNNSGTLPADGVVETVVVDNTIYGGTFTGDTYATLNATTGTNVTYIKGSVKNAVYGGQFTNFYANGNSPTYGNVTTDIYGGTFNAVYGARVGKVYGNVTLNIHGMTEGENPTGIWAAGTTAPVVGNVRLTIQPEEALTLSMPISAGSSDTGTVTGTTSALVTGGTYTNGFAVAGLKVKDVLASGLVPLKTADNTIVAVTDDMTTTGTESVTLVNGQWNDESASLALSDTTVTYDGKTDAKVPTETVKFYNTTIVKDTDYTVSYSRDGQATTDLNSIGTVTVTVTAKAPYSGTMTATYTIVRDGAIGDAIANVTQRTAAYDSNTVTADDSADLSDLKSDIKAILTDNASVLTEEEKTALNGLTTTVEGLEKAISIASTDLNTLGHRISEYDITTVTADDATGLKMLETALDRIKDSNLTAAQKARKQELKAHLAALNAKIDDVAAMMADAKEELAKYTAATVTADHSAALTKLASDIAAIPNGNLTAAQKTEKQTMANQVAALQKVITDTDKALTTALAAAAAYNAGNITSDDADELTALAAQLAAISDGNLTAQQKADKKAASDKIAQLLVSVKGAAEALAQIKTELNGYSAATVTGDDMSKLGDLAARLSAIVDSNLTAAEKAEKTELSSKVAALQAVVTDVAAQLAAVKTEADSYAAESVTADDTAKLAQLASDIADVKDANLTAAQKTEKQAAADKVTALQKVITDTAAQLQTALATVDTFDAEKVTSDDLTELASAKASLTSVKDGNLTAAQKAEKNTAIAAVTAMETAVEAAVDALAEAEAAVAAYNDSTVTADDSADLVALQNQLNGISNNHLTAAEQADKQVAADKVEALRQKLAGIEAALTNAKTAANAFEAATVTADDADALVSLKSATEAVADSNLTAQQKAAKQEVLAHVAHMQSILDDVAAQLAAVKTEAGKFSATAVTADDTAKLAQLASDIAAIPDGNLTAAQKTEKKAAADQVAALQKVITDTANALNEALAAAEAYNAGNITSDDEADLTALAAQLAAIPEGNLTAQQKADKQAASEKVAQLLVSAKGAAEALAQIKTALNGYSASTVTADDMGKLNELVASLNAIADNKLTTAEKAEKAELIGKIDELKAVVDDVADELAAVKTEAGKYAADSVTADDTAKLAQLASDIAAVPDANLTAAQKTEKQAAADQVAALQKVITDTAEALKSAKEEVEKFDPNTVKSENSEALAAAAAQLAAVPDGNLTAAQKSEKKAAADKVAAMQKTIADTAADLAEMKAEEAAFEPGKLTSADKAKLQALQTKLESYPADHLTDAEQAQLAQLVQSVKDKISAIEKAEELSGDIDEIAKLLEGKTTANITSESNADLIAARNAITELKKNTALTDADKQRVVALEKSLEELEEQLEKAEDAAEVPASVQTVKPENVEPQDKTGLTAAIKALEDAEKNFGANYTAAEKQAIADAKANLTAALAVIEEVESVQQSIAQLPATAEPDDEKAIADLQAALDAFSAMNERQKAMVTAAELAKVEKLGESLKDYKIVKGDKAAWTQESKKDLTFTVNGLFGKFEGVQVDGSTVDSKYYTVKSGSTIITLTDEFLDKLAKGEHTITAVYIDGKVSGTFTVKAKSASPATGDNTNVALLSLLALCSVASAAALTIGFKKRAR